MNKILLLKTLKKRLNKKTHMVFRHLERGRSVTDIARNKRMSRAGVYFHIRKIRKAIASILLKDG